MLSRIVSRAGSVGPISRIVEPEVAYCALVIPGPPSGTISSLPTRHVFTKRLVPRLVSQSERPNPLNDDAGDPAHLRKRTNVRPPSAAISASSRKIYIHITRRKC